MDDCVKETEPKIKWACRTSVGDIAVTVGYVVEEDLFYGVVISAKLDVYKSHELKAILTAAWGDGEPGNSLLVHPIHDDWYWSDKSVLASWERDVSTGDVFVLMTDLTLLDAVKAKQRSKASKNIGDL
jgi:hypothetical protein